MDAGSPVLLRSASRELFASASRRNEPICGRGVGGVLELQVRRQAGVAVVEQHAVEIGFPFFGGCDLLLGGGDFFFAAGVLGAADLFQRAIEGSLGLGAVPFDFGETLVVGG